MPKFTESNLTEAEVTRLLFVRDEPEKADLALVFGHADPARSARRVRHAVELYRLGFVPKLILSGGPLPGQPDVSEAEHMSKVAANLGVPEGAMLLEEQARNTWENARNALAILEEKGLAHGLATALLVSCPWHMRRVLLVTRKVFPSRIRLRCCPHGEECGEDSWTRSPECRQWVAAEVELLLALVSPSKVSRH